MIQGPSSRAAVRASLCAETGTVTNRTPTRMTTRHQGRAGSRVTPNRMRARDGGPWGTLPCVRDAAKGNGLVTATCRTTFVNEGMAAMHAAMMKKRGR